jgi:hypothetical protein
VSVGDAGGVIVHLLIRREPQLRLNETSAGGALLHGMLFCIKYMSELILYRSRLLRWLARWNTGRTRKLWCRRPFSLRRVVPGRISTLMPSILFPYAPRSPDCLSFEQSDSFSVIPTSSYTMLIDAVVALENPSIVALAHEITYLLPRQRFSILRDCLK